MKIRLLAVCCAACVAQSALADRIKGVECQGTATASYNAQTKQTTYQCRAMGTGDLLDGTESELERGKRVSPHLPVPPTIPSNPPRPGTLLPKAASAAKS